MKVCIATTQVPFIRGGAEVQAESLRRELVRRGYETDVVALPFKWYPSKTLFQCMLAARLYDLREVNGERIDLLIALKFPAFYVQHPAKVVWLLHQHRQAYDLWNTQYGDMHAWPDGEWLRSVIVQHDTRYLTEAVKVFAESENVAKRLLTYNGLQSTPLYHPPGGVELLGPSDYAPFVYYPSRIDQMKRQRLLVEAARHLKSDLKVVISGSGSQTELKVLESMIEEHGLCDRVLLTGFVSEEQKRHYYATCRCAFYGAYDEDYGYVPLEAFYSSKPVVVLSDGGAVTEFVSEGWNGFIVNPDPLEVAEALDRFGFDPAMARKFGVQGLESMKAKKVDWDHVVDALTGCVHG